MEIQEIRQKLQDYINSAAEEKIKALYTVLEGEIDTQFSHWDDPEFIVEMDDRVQELEEGKVKAISSEEFFAKSDEYLKFLQQKSAV